MVLVGYGINDNSLRVREKVEWIFFDIDCDPVHQRLLESVTVEPCYPCLYFEEKEKVKTVSVKTVQCQSSQESLAHWSLDAA